MNKKISLLQKRLKDDRGKKVIFLSHCLLNENTRYLGGAFRKAGVDELIDDLQKRGIGIVQMKCPEQKVWGGVLKEKMLRGYGIKGTSLNVFRKLYMKCFLRRTKRKYRKMAVEVTLEILDYLKSGCEVVGIVGIKGSPTCGVTAALDMNRSSKFVAGLNIKTLTREYFNEECYKRCLVQREGLFIHELKKQLYRARIEVNFFEHDLLAEMQGNKTLYLLEEK